MCFLKYNCNSRALKVQNTCRNLTNQLLVAPAMRASITQATRVNCTVCMMCVCVCLLHIFSAFWKPLRYHCTPHSPTGCPNGTLNCKKRGNSVNFRKSDRQSTLDGYSLVYGPSAPGPNSTQLGLYLGRKDHANPAWRGTCLVASRRL